MRTAAAFVAVACLAIPLPGAACEAPAVVTLLESQAKLLRGTGRFSVAEGVRLQAGDLLEVSGNGLVQIQCVDGTKFSVGPQGRLRIGTPSTAARGLPGDRAAVSGFYLLQGWSKFSVAQPAPLLRLGTPLFALTAGDAVAVLRSEGTDASVFVEKGEVRLSDGFAKPAAAGTVALRAGQFYTRKPNEKGVVGTRPAAAFVAGMPKQYQDNLPDLLARHRQRDVAPRRLGDVVYGDVEAWLKGPPEPRHALVHQLRPLANEPEFRKAVIADMRSHPEWDRILFPEKYQPPPGGGPTSPQTGNDSAKAQEAP